LEKMMRAMKITVHLTPRQCAALEEAADTYADGELVEIPAGQRRTTQRAADILREAFKESGAPWPW
jgi:hypothetical protein